MKIGLSQLQRFYGVLIVAVFTTVGSFAQPCSNRVNVVTNPDFSAGNTGFSSQIPYSGSCAANSYTVSTNLNKKCSGWPNVSEHSSAGVMPPNFLVIDGAPYVNNIDLWRQTVNVCSGKEYTFSFWTHSIYAPTFGLTMAIDNSNTSVTVSQGGWTQHSTTWLAPFTGSVSIAIIQETGNHYRDFGIDDVSFSYCACDSVPVTNTKPVSVCLCDSVLGINSIHKAAETGFLLYPNPSTGSFVVHTNTNDSKSISIYDMTGALVFEKPNTKESIITADLAKQPKGIYLVKLSYKGITEARRIVIE